MQYNQERTLVLFFTWLHLVNRQLVSMLVNFCTIKIMMYLIKLNYRNKSYCPQLLSFNVSCPNEYR